MQTMRNGVRVPAAERLAATLFERIEQGQYAPGEWLPTERELAAEFRADRSTIRTALSSLAERRLIMREPGCRPRVIARPEAENGAPEPRDTRIALQTLAVLSPQTPHYLASPAIQRGALSVLTLREAPYRLVVYDNSAETLPETIRREQQALEAIGNEGISGARSLASIQRGDSAGHPPYSGCRNPGRAGGSARSEPGVRFRGDR